MALLRQIFSWPSSFRKRTFLSPAVPKLYQDNISKSIQSLKGWHSEPPIPHLQIFFDEIIFMVPKAGLEPARPSPLPPQDSVSTNSTTWAIMIIAVSPLLLPRQFLLPEANHLSSPIFQSTFRCLAIRLFLPLPYFLRKLQE